MLNGRERNHERFDSEGITYAVTGGGGRFLTDLTECPADHPEMLAGEQTHHCMVLELDDTLSATAIDTDGAVIDEFSLELP